MLNYTTEQKPWHRVRYYHLCSESHSYTAYEFGTDGVPYTDYSAGDILGLIQNDPRYQYSGLEDLQLHNIPQKQLSHYGISVTATSDDDRNITMLSDGSSANAEVAITIINTRGFDLPQTGDRGTWMFGVAGGALMLLAASIILLAFRKKEKDHTVDL